MIYVGFAIIAAFAIGWTLRGIFADHEDEERLLETARRIHETLRNPDFK